MNKFDKLAEKLGWEKPNINIPLFYREDQGISTVAFSIAGIYETYMLAPLNEDIVNRGISCFSQTKFKVEQKNWIIPMLFSDYYYHKRDSYNELFWAKEAIRNNSKLKRSNFSKCLKWETNER